MAFEAFKDFFSGSDKNDAPSYNKEAKRQTPEGQAMTGREGKNVSDDVSTREESAPATPEEREEKVLQGVGKIMNEFGIHETELLGQEEFFVKELHKRGFLTERDLQFNATELVRGVLKTIARKEA